MQTAGLTVSVSVGVSVDSQLVGEQKFCLVESRLSLIRKRSLVVLLVEK